MDPTFLLDIVWSRRGEQWVRQNTALSPILDEARWWRPQSAEQQTFIFSESVGLAIGVTHTAPSPDSHCQYITDPPHPQDYGHSDGVRQLLSASMTITVCQWPGLRVMGGTRPGHGGGWSEGGTCPALPSCDERGAGGGQWEWWVVTTMSLVTSEWWWQVITVIRGAGSDVQWQGHRARRGGSLSHWAPSSHEPQLGGSPGSPVLAEAAWAETGGWGWSILSPGPAQPAAQSEQEREREHSPGEQGAQGSNRTLRHADREQRVWGSWKHGREQWASLLVTSAWSNTRVICDYHALCRPPLNRTEAECCLEIYVCYWLSLLSFVIKSERPKNVVMVMHFAHISIKISRGSIYSFHWCLWQILSRWTRRNERNVWHYIVNNALGTL